MESRRSNKGSGTTGKLDLLVCHQAKSGSVSFVDEG
jgi:hypothetical protein